MRWLKRDMWKAGITLTGILLLLVLMVWVPVSEAGAYEGASGPVTPVTATVQATPTVDVTMAALSKEQLTLQVKQLQNQLQNQNSWLVNNSTALIAAITAIAVAVFGIVQWAGTARQAKDKDLKAQAEERFKTAVTALGDEKESVQVGGAILLRSFLNKEDKKSYERYYAQIFDLAVANLRLPRTSHPSEDPDGIPHSPGDSDIPLPLTTLSQALIVVFKEAFPLARSQNKEGPQTLDKTGILSRGIGTAIMSLDASRVQLDRAFLLGADLKQTWMPWASLRKANFYQADLSEAILGEAILNEAELSEANLSGANLGQAKLIKTVLIEAKLIKTDLSSADLSEANLSGADLSEADLSFADLEDADLTETKLDGADLSGANLSGAEVTEDQLKKAKSLDGATIPDGSIHP